LDSPFRRPRADRLERAQLGAKARRRHLGEPRRNAVTIDGTTNVKFGRPRTLLGLTLVGLALVTLPLLVAIGNAALQLDRLARESEAVADESGTSSQESQRLWNVVNNLERYARQY